MTDVNETPEGVIEDTSADHVEDISEGEGQEPELIEEAGEPAPKPKKTANERIAELTAKQRQAERDAAAKDEEARYWRDQALRNQPAPAPQANDGKPTSDQFESYDDYVEALTDWKAENTVNARLAAQQQQSTIQTRVQTFEQRVATQFPDGEPEGLSALRRAPSLPEGVQEVILSSENGPKLADHLGNNPAELRRLSSLTPTMQAFELAKLEQRLAAPPKTATTAPAPHPTARGNGGRFETPPDTNDFAAFERHAAKVLGGS